LVGGGAGSLKGRVIIIKLEDKVADVCFETQTHFIAEELSEVQDGVELYNPAAEEGSHQ
jgi:hypothetical protein